MFYDWRMVDPFLQRRLHACVGAGLIAKITPMPIPDTLQRVRDTVGEDDIQALDSIKLALAQLQLVESKSTGWWVRDRPFQAVFPSQSVSAPFF